jgi:glycosyltransferase involved in cell wall biosynthesis
MISELSNPGIFSTSPPLATHRAALMIKRRFPSVRWIADFRDPPGYTAEECGVIGPRPTRKLALRVFTHADVIVANTDKTAEDFQAQFPEHHGKIKVLWNGFDPEDSLAALSLPDRPYRILGHFGSIYGRRRPGRLIASARRLSESGRITPRALRIYLAGGLDMHCIADRESFDALQEEGFLECTGPKPRPEAQRLMATSDYLLLVDVDGSSLHVPAKVFEYVRIGRPILAYTDKDSATERVLQRSGVPFVAVHPTDSEEVSDGKLLALLNLPADPVQMAPAFREEFSASYQTARLARWLTSGPD